MAPILEILRLVTPNKAAASNDVRILSSLRAVRQNLKEAVHNTDSRFYVQTEHPENIYVFGEWDSAAQHVAFTTSARRGDILKPQEGVLQFVDLVHVQMPEGGIERLLDGKRVFRLGRRVLGDGENGKEAAGKMEGVVEMTRCDEGFEEQVYVFSFGGDKEVGVDERSESVEVVNMELT